MSSLSIMQVTLAALRPDEGRMTVLCMAGRFASPFYEIL
jgi:hypothetical protein